jgi:RHS repeat-associated protein
MLKLDTRQRISTVRGAMFWASLCALFGLQTAAYADAPPAHTLSTGTMAGTAGAEGGAATYTIPIVVAPGRAGVQPSLALTYNSRAGDGLMGVGWSLSGVSSIHRCPQTPEQDGHTRGVTFTSSDRLCLDGQRLMLAAGGTYGAEGAEYRTEIDSNARVIQVGGDLTSAATCFRVEDKSGLVSHYGAAVIPGSAKSSLTCAASTSNARVVPGGASVPLSWMVEKIEDRAGNNQIYQYNNFGNGEVLVDHIAYTGTSSGPGDRLVAFAYGPRATYAPEDSSSSYLAGGLTMQTKALIGITSSASGQTVRRYIPAYEKSQYNLRLELKSVQECASDAGNSCHPATTFGYIDGNQHFDLTSLEGIGVAEGADPGATPQGVNDTQIAIIGDLDGDGAREAAASIDDAAGSHLYMLQLTADREVQHSVDLTGTKFNLSPQLYADIDGDGRVELLEFPQTPLDASGLAFGVSNWQRGAPIGSLLKQGWSAQQNMDALFTRVPSTIPYVYGSDGPVYAADVDGDGRTDIIVVKPYTCGSGCKAAFVYFNNLSGRLGSTTGTWDGPYHLFDLPASSGTLAKIDRIADFDGDGLPDFYLVNSGSNNSFAGIEITQPGGHSASFRACSDAPGNLNLKNAKGDPADACHWEDGYFAKWIDVNGDGLDDLVLARPGDSKPSWHVYLDVGNGQFGSDINTSSALGLDAYESGGGKHNFRYADKLPSMDVDNDGKQDILVAQSIVLKMCTIAIVGPVQEVPGDPDSYHCPIVGRPPIGNGTSSLQCPAWSCPQDVGANGVDYLPDMTGDQAGRWVKQWNGLPAFPAYDSQDWHNGPGADNSAYKLNRLKFTQTAANTITVESFATPLISSLRAPGLFTAGDDLYGDGLGDLVTTVGCTKGSHTFNGTPYVNYTTDNCSAVDGDYGPPTFPDGTPSSYLANHAVLYANLNDGAQASISRPETSVPADLGITSVASVPLLPGLLDSAINGVGDDASWSYAPLAQPIMQGDIPLYDISTAPGCGYVDNRHYYFTSSMPVVTSFSQNNGLDGDSGFRSSVFGYTEAMYNHYGRGFLGFRSITSLTSNSEASRRVETTTMYKQKFPLVGNVEQISHSAPGTGHVFSSESDVWTCGSNRSACPQDTSVPPLSCPTGQPTPPAAGTVYQPELDTSTVQQFDLANGNLVGTTTTVNARDAQTSGWDAHGNLTHQVVTRSDGGEGGTFVTSQIVTTDNGYSTAQADLNDWWISKLLTNEVTTSIAYAAGVTGHPLPDSSLTPNRDVVTSYVWSTTGNRTLLTRKVQEGEANQEAITAYGYPSPSYGLPTSITVSGLGISPARTTLLSYTKDGSAPAADGYFVLTTTNGCTALTDSDCLTTTTNHSIRDGQVTASTDPTGVSTVSLYDGFGRETQVDYLDASQHAMMPSAYIGYAPCSGAASNACVGLGEGANEANSAWRVTKVQSGYPTTVDWFDVLGRSIKHAERAFDTQFVVSYTNYDEMNKVDTQSTPFFATAGDGGVTMWTYDALGRPTSKQAPGGASENDLVSTEYKYDGATTTIKVHGSSVSATQPCPADTTTNLCMDMTRSYDVLGRLEQTTQHKGSVGYATTNFWYDGPGNLVAIKDPDSVVSTWSYDDVGHRTGMHDADAGIWTYTPNGLGELTHQTDARSVATDFTYDDLGRLVQRAATFAAAPAPAPKYVKDTWVYDDTGVATGGKGLLVSTQRDTGDNAAAAARIWKTSNGYEAATRRLSSITSCLGDGDPCGEQSWITGIGYDTFGHEGTVTYPSGLTVRKGYTDYGVLDTLTDDATGIVYWTATAQDAWGNVTGETFAGNVNGNHHASATTGQLDRKGWSSSSTVLDTWTYGYDSFGNLKTQSRSISGGSSVSEGYTYDGLQRLIQASRSNVPNNPPTVSYAYKASGNFDYKSDYSLGSTGAYHYGTSGCGPHGVSSISTSSGSLTYSCDANGNVTGGSALSAVYDFNNQPWQVTRSSGQASFEYAADGALFHQETSSDVSWFGPRGYEVTQTSSDTVERHELGPVVVLREDGIDSIEDVLRDRLGSQVALVDAANVQAPPGAPSISISPTPSFDGNYTVSMTAVSGAPYHVLYESADGVNEQQVLAGTQQTWSPQPPRSVGTYRYRAKACVSAGVSCSDYSLPVNEEVEPAPPAITSILPSPSTDGFYTVTWTASTGARSYTLEEQFNGSGNWTAVSQNASDLTWSPPTAKPAGTYAYRVRGCLVNDCGNPSAVVSEQVSLMCSVAVPGAITTTANPAAGFYDLSWPAVASATSYTLEEVGGQSWTVTSPTRHFANQPDGTYDYHVRACTSTCCSAYNDPPFEQVVGTPPGYPGPIHSSANPSYDGSFTLTWGASSGDTGGNILYKLERTTSPNHWQAVTRPDETTRSWSTTNQPDGTIGFRVKACRSDSSSPCSLYDDSYPELVQLAPPPPAQISITEGTPAGHFTVNWSASATATQYWIDEKINSGDWTMVDLGGPITGTSLARVEGNGTYSYRVKGCYIDTNVLPNLRCGNYSNTATEVVTGSGVPTEPAFIDGPSSCSSSCSFTLSWGASSGAVHYELHTITDPPRFDNIKYYDASHTSISQTDVMTPGNGTTLYYHWIRGCTMAAPPPPPPDPTPPAGEICSPWKGPLVVAVGNRSPQTVIVTTSYDAFGKTRKGDFSDRANGTLDLLPDTLRGFTGQEHVDDVRLLHMGGRVYDYQLGRFLGVDPIIQNPANSQSLNPYSYIGNNPLSGKDPTGYEACAPELKDGDMCTVTTTVTYHDSRSADPFSTTTQTITWTLAKNGATTYATPNSGKGANQALLNAINGAGSKVADGPTMGPVPMTMTETPANMRSCALTGTGCEAVQHIIPMADANPLKNFFGDKAGVVMSPNDMGNYHNPLTGSLIEDPRSEKISIGAWALGLMGPLGEGIGALAETATLGDAAATAGVEYPLLGLPRSGSALKTDADHSFPDAVDAFAGSAAKFSIPTRGIGGVVERESQLLQLEGGLNKRGNGVFEWIIDKGEVTHRRFIPNGQITGSPNQIPPPQP